MRVRFKGHSLLNEQVKEDWQRAIEMDPESFDALLYRPKDDANKEKAGGYEEATFGTVDDTTDHIEYMPPVHATVLDCPQESDGFLTMDAGGTLVGAPDEGAFLAVRIAHRTVPTGSILEWEEEVSRGKTKRVWWYVLKHKSFGTTGAATIHYLIPSKDFEGDL